MSDSVVQVAISVEAERRLREAIVTLESSISALVIKIPADVTQAKFLEKECTRLEKEIETERTNIVGPMNEMVKKVNALAKDIGAPIATAKELVRKKQIDYANKLEEERLAKEREVIEIIQKINAFQDEIDMELYADSVTNTDPRITAAIEARRAFFAEQERMRVFKEEQRKEQERLDKIKEEQGIEAARIAKEQAELRLSQKNADNERQRIADDHKRREAEERAAEELKKSEKDAEAGKVKGLRKVVQFEVVDEMLVPRVYTTADDVKIRAAIKDGVRDIPGVRIWEEAKIQ